MRNDANDSQRQFCAAPPPPHTPHTIMIDAGLGTHGRGRTSSSDVVWYKTRLVSWVHSYHHVYVNAYHWQYVVSRKHTDADCNVHNHFKHSELTDFFLLASSEQRQLGS